MDSHDQTPSDDKDSQPPPSNNPDKVSSTDAQVDEKTDSTTTHDTTKSLTESLLRVRSQLSEETKNQPRFIALHILGIENPVTFTDRYEISIGRFDSTANESPDIDLGGLSLDASGISRKHLKLVLNKERWYAEDLKSSNGTWLNGKSLTAFQREALRDGDQLRVGNIFIIVSLSTEVDGAKPVADPPKTDSLPDSLRLSAISIAPNQTGMSLKFVSDELLPYIAAVIEMIKHVDRAKKRSYRDISVVSLTFANPIITIQLNCAHEALAFWRGLSASVPMNNQDSPIDESTQAIQPISNMSESSVASDQDTRDIAKRFVGEHLPLLPADQSEHYQNLLMPPIAKCLNSGLRIAR